MRHLKSTPENTARHNYKLIPTLLLIAPYLKKYAFRVALSMVFLVLAKLATIGVPLVTKPIYDTLGGQMNELIALPVMLLLFMGILRFASSLFNELRNLAFITASIPSVRYINTHFFQHLCRLPLSYHLSRQTGGLSRDIERGSMAIRSLYYNVTVTILPTVFELLMVFIILAVNYPLKYALIMLVSIAVYAVFTFFVSRWRIKFRAQLNVADSKASAIAIDALLNYETVKYFNNEKHEEKRYYDSLGAWISNYYKSESSLSLLNGGQALVIAVSLTIMMISAAADVQKGLLTIGDFALINGFLLQVFIPLNVLGFVFKSIQTAVVDVNQMMQLLDIKKENHLNLDKKLQISRGDVRFENVGFSYQRNREIIKDLSFAVKGGQKIAIVGESGAGKTTIARLLFGFYQPDNGSIYIDGQDINLLDIDSLRRQIGVVPQDVVLFNDTLAYNIAYGRPGATKEEIKKAADMAYLSHFIDALPDGYETMVGERGLKLSGGEKQRVAIARAILKQPKILILDEATSSLDSKSEQAIQKAIKEVTRSRTSFIIAHRLSTIQDADYILVMQQGKLIESGTHHALMEANGYFAKLWEIQQKAQQQVF